LIKTPHFVLILLAINPLSDGAETVWAAGNGTYEQTNAVFGATKHIHAVQLVIHANIKYV
jgi:hypothetical protein